VATGDISNDRQHTQLDQDPVAETNHTDAAITYAIETAHDDPALFASIATEVITQEGTDPRLADHLATALEQSMDRKTLLTKFASAGLLAVVGFRLAQRQAAAWSYNPATYTTPIAFRCYPVSQWYGAGMYSHNPANGENAKAIDIDCPTGTPVYAMKDGVIFYEGWEGKGGIVCRIRHNDGLESVYAHLSRTIINKGDRVRGGYTRIGNSGATGEVTAAHLHFALKVAGTWTASSTMAMDNVPGVSRRQICP
jgi:murein DD-endopeptidase MepM/ murein hydrolase activator NlpD